MLQSFNTLKYELYPDGIARHIKRKSDLSTLLFLLKSSQLVRVDRNIYVFELPYPNFERSIIATFNFQHWVFSSTLNGLPLMQCIPWYDVVRLFLHCNRLRNARGL